MDAAEDVSPRVLSSIKNKMKRKGQFDTLMSGEGGASVDFAVLCHDGRHGEWCCIIAWLRMEENTCRVPNMAL